MTLKDLVIRQQVTGETDSELVTDWLLSNGNVVDYIEIISNLSTRKIKHDEFILKSLTDNLNLYSATPILISDFGLIDGYKLDTITRRYIIASKLEKDFKKGYSEDIKWLQEFCPEHNLPAMFWSDFLNYLNNLGIYFKDQKIKGE